MLMQWLIETFDAKTREATVYLVKAKTYGDACVVASHHHANPTFKLLAQFEQLSTEKNLSQRIA